MPGPTLTASDAPGWFGKMPSLGDFVTRRLPADLVHRWDEWLQDAMAHGRAEFGSQWQAVYLVAPILRFWIAPEKLGTPDERGWAGLVMPSVDRVGRYYPLMFARPMASLAEALAACAWYAALDLAARRVLDPAFTVDDLECELETVSRTATPAPGVATQAAAAGLLARCGSPRSCSIWWTGDAGEDTRFMCFDGLPRPSDFTSMFGVAA